MKNNKKIFATLFLDMKNVHLMKDPGMIPFTFEKEFGFHSCIPLFNYTVFQYKKKYFNNFDMPLLKGGKHRFTRFIFGFIWLFHNAKKIDVFNLFFFNRETWILLWLYKALNPKGLVYVHCDSDGSYLLTFDFKKSFFKRIIIRNVLLKEKILKDVLWGIQNKSNEEKLRGHWPFVNTAFVPNGFFWPSTSDTSKKNNIILTVARNGIPPKRTDLLLEAFAAIAEKYPDWVLKIVGPVENSFKQYIHDYFLRNKKIKERVIFTGEILDRVELEKQYSMAKVFCLPSVYESFGIAVVEALSRGCFIVGSDIPSNVQLTENEKFGVLFKNGNLEDFINKLDFVLNNISFIDNKKNCAIEFAYTHYCWNNTLKTIFDWISRKQERN